jgi:hypothetical protein
MWHSEMSRKLPKSDDNKSLLYLKTFTFTLAVFRPTFVHVYTNLRPNFMQFSPPTIRYPDPVSGWKYPELSGIR